MAAQPPPSPSRAGVLDLVGGALALDFCNTSSGRGAPTHQEHLREAADVCAWAVHAGIVPQAAAAPDLLARALALREAVYAIARARARAEAPERTWLDALAAEHAACLAQARLAPDGDAYRWGWETPGTAAVLGPIALSAMALLTHAPTGRLKQCQGRQCGWLFLDETRNRSRRWCEMAVCGNRAKQRRRRGS